MSNVPMTRPEEALSIQVSDFPASQTFAGLEGGRIMRASARGFSISDDGGMTWNEPFAGRDENGDPVVDAKALVSLPGGAVGRSEGRHKPGAFMRHDDEMLFRRSDDEGKTWSAPVVMNTGLIRAHAVKDTLLRTTSGRIIQPAYFSVGQGSWHHEDAPFVGGYLNGKFVSTDAHYYDPHFTVCYVLYSDDEGETWRTNSDGELLIQLEPGGQVARTNEPSVAEVEPGRLLMIMRNAVGRLFQAWSEDDGDTWSRPEPTQLAASTAPGQIRRLPNGHLLVVWNQQSEQEIREGFIRTRMSSAISRNGGGIWECFQNVESIHEETHVEPGPIRMVRPEGRYSILPGAAEEVDSEYAVPLPEGYGRWSYPAVYVAEDRVLIAHHYTLQDTQTGEETGRQNKLKVLPISWFYGGMDPNAQSTLLTKIRDLPPRP